MGRNSPLSVVTHAYPERRVENIILNATYQTRKKEFNEIVRLSCVCDKVL